jgi:sec-independent protein translocase protein TatA
MLPHVGPMELIIILVIVIVIFGPKALPSLGKSIGGGLRNLKQSMNAKDAEADAEEVAERAAESAKRAAVKDLGPRA